jgi:hypothetical protein
MDRQSRTELERFFLLNDRDRELVEQRRRPHNRLGFVIQLGTVTLPEWASNETPTSSHAASLAVR